MRRTIPWTCAAAAALWACLAPGSPAPARGDEPWTSFRGPTDQGHVPSARLPHRWSEQENVVWKTTLAGKAWSSPVIWDGRIWMTNASADGKELSVLCLDKSSGKILIDKRLHQVAEPQDNVAYNSYGSPSPVIEEGRVYVSFGSPYNACLDSRTGDVVWQRTDFVCNHYRGPGSSPLLFRDLLILHFDGSDRQYVAALDKRTGKTVWKTDRSVDFRDIVAETGRPQRDGDFRKAFSTPLIAAVHGQPVLISLGSMALYGYEPATGKELWRVDSVGSHSGSARPVLGHDLVFSAIGYTAGIWAVRPDGRGVVTNSHVAWKYDTTAPKRSSPILVGQHLFHVDSSGVAVCLEAKTGKVLWKERLGGNYSASPIHADGRLYFCDESGRTNVVAAAPVYKVLAVNRLDAGCMASPAASGNALFLRTKKALYRIEDRGSPAASVSR